MSKKKYKKGIESLKQQIDIHRNVKNHQSKTGGMLLIANVIAWFLSMLENIPYVVATLDLRPSVID